jgi:taurine--2-oxoglutarate transaminase
LYTGHHKIIGRYRSYHGATMGALPMTGDWRPAAEPGIPGAIHARRLLRPRLFGYRSNR